MASNQFVKPETGRILREEMGYTNKSKNCKDCAHHKEVQDQHLDRSWTQACALFGEIGLIAIDLTGICKHHKDKTSPCG